MAQNKTEILAVLQLLRKYNYKVCKFHKKTASSLEFFNEKSDSISVITIAFIYRVRKNNWGKKQT